MNRNEPAEVVDAEQPWPSRRTDLDTYLLGRASVRLFLFQPSFKLIDKIRDGAITVKGYSCQPTASCDRLIQHDATGDKVNAPLGEYRAGLDMVVFLHTIGEA